MLAAPFCEITIRNAVQRTTALLIALAIMSGIGACAPAAQPNPTATLQGAFVPTRIPRSATPTHTQIPTETWTLTPSATFTASPTVTDTPRPTLTPADTPTPTPSLDMTGTAQAEAAATHFYATVEAQLAATLEARTAATQTAIALMPTMTPTPTTGETVTTIGFNTIQITSTIDRDAPVSGAISFPQYMQIYAFDGSAGDRIDVEVLTSSGNLSPALFIVHPDGREIARFEVRRELVSSGAVRGLTLPETGRYLIGVTRLAGLFGLTEGTFTLTIRASAPDQAPEGIFAVETRYNENISGSLGLNDPGHVYVFSGRAGDRVNITMTRFSNNLDPFLILTDSLGNILTWNDDDLRAGVTDSVISEYVLPRDGYYSVLASRFFNSDNSGDYRLKITQIPSLPQTIVYGVLDPVNSNTIRADNQFFSNFSVGDSVVTGADGRSQELRMQTLLTFQLPPVASEQIERVELRLQPCLEARGGFSALGVLTIYADPYGSLTTRRDFTRVSTGARIVAEQSNCGPVDVTEITRDHLESGQIFSQYRLMFRQSQNNGQGDEVLLTPSLVFFLSE